MKRDDIRESIEDSYSKICTFSPQTNSKDLIFNENSKSAHKRLYDDYARRKYNSQLNSKKIESECENLANKKHLKNLDRKRIEKLYLDHKKNKIHKTTLQKQFDEISGLTFKPSIPNADKYEISNDFHQRNEILLHKKNIFSDWYQKILKENFDTKHKNYTVEQVEEIKNSIIDRLYKKDLDKILNKRSIYDTKERDAFDYKSELRNNQFFNSEFSQNYPNKSNSKSKNNKTSNQHNTSHSKSKNSARNILNISTNDYLNRIERNNQTSNVNLNSNNYNNSNSIGMRFSFKNDNIKNLENNLNIKEDPNPNYLGNSDNDQNINTIKNLNNNLSSLSGNNNFDSDNLNFNSKTEDYNSNNEESVITEIDNHNNDKNSARRISNNKNPGTNDQFYQNPKDYLNLNIKKDFTNENLTTDKKLKTIDSTFSTNGNNNISNTHQNRKAKDSEALLKHFLNNKTANRVIKDHSSNGNQVANSERMLINNIKNEQNNNLMFIHISLASPLNLLSTKSTNNHAGNSSIKNANESYSIMDQYNRDNINNEFETINQDNDNHFN